MESKAKDIHYFKDDEEPYSDSDNQRAVLNKKQFPFQSGERLLPFQIGGEARGLMAGSVDIRKLSLEDRLRFGVSAQLLKDVGLEACEGYTGFKGFLTYRNLQGDVFLFEKVISEKEKDKDEYVLRLCVNNQSKS